MKALYQQREIPSLVTYKLEAMERACARAGFPQRGRKTILVAGTNGKGSTVHYLTQLFMLAGFKVGTYVSPHVIERGERIRLSGTQVSERTLKSYEKKYAASLKSLSYFERLTFIAFLIFRDRHCDLQILEVGMGGRLDATNVSDPDISVITRIDYDHQELLGKTLRQIALEKAGIMRTARPVFVGPQVRDVLLTLREAARERKALIRVSAARHEEYRDLLAWMGRERGHHQEQNACLALQVFHAALQQWEIQKRVAIKQAALRKALRAPLPLARIQILKRRPLWIVDGSHNANSVEALAMFLKAKRVPRGSFEMIFGAMDDKERREMIRIMMPWVGRLHLPVFYPERQVSPCVLQREWQTAWHQNRQKNLHHRADPLVATVGLSMAATLSSILKAPRSRPLLCVGSLYLAGAFLRAYKKVKIL